jgi:hypothetical protein
MYLPLKATMTFNLGDSAVMFQGKYSVASSCTSPIVERQSAHPQLLGHVKEAPVKLSLNSLVHPGREWPVPPWGVHRCGPILGQRNANSLIAFHSAAEPEFFCERTV